MSASVDYFSHPVNSESDEFFTVRRRSAALTYYRILRTRDRETLRHSVSSGTVSELESGELRLVAVNIFTKRKDPVAMQRWCRWGPDTGDLVTEPVTEYLAPHNFWLR